MQWKVSGEILCLNKSILTLPLIDVINIIFNKECHTEIQNLQLALCS